MAQPPPATPCEPVPTLNLDLRESMSCVQWVQGLFEAYVAATSGNVRVRIRVADRWTDFAKPNVPELLTLYQTLYNQCPAAAAAGLPDLAPGRAYKRGRPTRHLNEYPSLGPYGGLGGIY